MATNITEADSFDATVAAPDDGDVENAASITAALTGFQAIGNRSRFLYNRMPQGLLIGGDAYCAGGSNTVSVTAVEYLCIQSGMYNSNADTTIGISATADQWHYVYAGSAGVGAAFNLTETTTAPDPATGYVYRTGFLGQRYIASFRTDAGSAVIPSRKVRGVTMYRVSKVALSKLTALAITNPTINTWTDVALGKLIPPHVRMAIIELEFISNISGDAFEVRCKGDTTSVWSVKSVWGTGSAVPVSRTIEIECDATAGDTGRVIQWQLNGTGGANTTVNIHVLGYRE